MMKTEGFFYGLTPSIFAHGQQVVNGVVIMLAAGLCAVGCLIYEVIALLGKSKLTGWLLLSGGFVSLLLIWVVYEFF